MPTTKRELALAAALAKLQGIVGITGLTVERNRRDQVEDFPAIVLRDGGHSIDDAVNSYDRVEARAEVELYVKATPAQNAGTLLNELYGAAIAALVADQSLAGTAHQVRESGLSDPVIDTGDGADAMGSAVLSIAIEFWTDRNSPY